MPQDGTGAHDIFVSHSHGDRKAVEKVVSQWEGWGYRVYADFRDERLRKASEEKIMTRDLADHLRRTIRRCLIFVFVASPKSALSGWMPWELGLAHGSVGRIHIYLLNPRAMHAFSTREYLELYKETTFSRDGAKQYLEKTLNAARRQLNKPAILEAHREWGKAFAEGGMPEVLRHPLAATEQGGATMQGIAEAGPSRSMPGGPPAPPWNPWDPFAFWAFWTGRRR